MDHMGGQTFLVIGRWYPKSSIDQSWLEFFTQPIPEIFAPIVSTHSLGSIFVAK